MKKLRTILLLATLHIYTSVYAQSRGNFRDEAGRYMVANPNKVMFWCFIFSLVIGAVIGYFLSNSPRVNTTKLNGIFFGVVGGVVIGFVFLYLFGENPYSNQIIQKNFILTGVGACIGSLGLPILLNFLKGEEH